MLTKQGFAPILITLIVGILLIGSFAFYKITQKQIDLPQNTPDKAELFLETTLKELRLNSQIIATTKDVNFQNPVDGMRSISKKLSGYSISPAIAKSFEYFTSRTFVRDSYNTGDATFHSSEAYRNDSIICIDYYKTIAPNNDYTQCDDTTASKCTTTSETFCANLN